jgi:hypothetical protein
MDLPVAQPSPSEWRISRAQGRPVPVPDPAPLMQFGQRFQPTAAFHKPPALESLPLFDFQPTSSASVEVAPDTPIETLADYRMELHCCGGATTYPLALLAQSLPQGGRTSLAAAIGLFRCERCRQPTRESGVGRAGRRRIAVERVARGVESRMSSMNGAAQPRYGIRALAAIRGALKAAGVEFIERNGGGGKVAGHMKNRTSHVFRRLTTWQGIWPIFDRSGLWLQARWLW